MAANNNATPSTIVVIQEDEILLSKAIIDNELEAKLKERNKQYDAIESLIKEKGADYYFGEAAGKKELKKLYHDLELTTIEEVHFKCNQLIVDVDLDKKLWHSMNIWVTGIDIKEENTVVETQCNLVEVKTPNIKNPRTWDVSGRDALDITTMRIKARQPGDDGLWGVAGRSGGNVEINAKKIFNQLHWLIVSHGGKGSRGEDGDDGIDGINGEPINFNLQEWFENGKSVEDCFEDQRIECKATIVEHKDLVAPWPNDANKFFHKSFKDELGRKYELVKGLRNKLGVSSDKNLGKKKT